VKENETAAVRCIGINVETRSDFINEDEVKRLRYLGVTKVEIGVQTTDDRVQEITKRGHDLKSVVEATALLKDAGFKISYHMMPNLPGSTPEIDKKMVGELFADDKYQPDYLKIYPCVVVPKSILSSIYRKGLFKTYDDKTLEDILLQEIKDVPEWCRIDRIARDIPSTDIESGFKSSNIRQILEERLKKMGKPCRDIRAREIQNTIVDPTHIELVTRKYAASGGQEFFISYEDVKQDKLVALLRLRFPRKTLFLSSKARLLFVKFMFMVNKLLLEIRERARNNTWGGGRN
jgi:elongator complex protein 3